MRGLGSHLTSPHLTQRATRPRRTATFAPPDRVAGPSHPVTPPVTPPSAPSHPAVPPDHTAARPPRAGAAGPARGGQSRRGPRHRTGPPPRRPTARPAASLCRAVLSCHLTAGPAASPHRAARPRRPATPPDRAVRPRHPFLPCHRHAAARSRRSAAGVIRQRADFVRSGHRAGRVRGAMAPSDARRPHDLAEEGRRTMPSSTPHPPQTPRARTDAGRRPSAAPERSPTPMERGFFRQPGSRIRPPKISHY